MTDPATDPAFQDLRDRARHWLERNRPDRAADAARAALELVPEDVEARVLLADSLSQSGGEESLREAADIARSVIERQPDHVEARLVLADACYQTDQSEEARAAAVRALELQPECAHAHALLAWLEIDDERWQTAIEQAEAALAIDPRQPNAETARQRARANLGLPDDRPNAAQILGHAEEVACEGMVVLDNGRRQEALELFGRALTDDPGQLTARRGLARWMQREHPLGSRLAGVLLGIAGLSWPLRLGILVVVYLGYRWITSGSGMDPALVTIVAAAGAGLMAVFILSCCGPLAIDVALRLAAPLRPVLPPLAIVLSGISGWLAAAAGLVGLLAMAKPQLTLLVPALLLLAVMIPLSGLLRVPRPGLRGFVAVYALMAFGFALASLIGTLVDWEQTPLVAIAGVLLIVMSGWINRRR